MDGAEDAPPKSGLEAAFGGVAEVVDLDDITIGGNRPVLVICPHAAHGVAICRVQWVLERGSPAATGHLYGEFVGPRHCVHSRTGRPQIAHCRSRYRRRARWPSVNGGASSSIHPA